MALLTIPGSLSKGTTFSVTLDKSALFALSSVAGNAHFSTQSNVKSCLIHYTGAIPGAVRGQLKILSFDLSEATPAADFTVSSSCVDTFVIESIVLENFNGSVFKLAASDIPSGLDVSFGQGPVGTDDVYAGYFITDPSFAVKSRITKNNQELYTIYGTLTASTKVVGYTSSGYAVTVLESQADSLAPAVLINGQFSYSLDLAGTVGQDSVNGDWASASGIFVDSNDIYICGNIGGRPVVWKNGSVFSILDSYSAGVFGISVYNGDVYCVGNHYNTNRYVPCMWLNGSRSDLAVPSGASPKGTALAIEVNSDGVYISGYTWPVRNVSSGARVSVWVNGSLTRYDTPSEFSSVRSAVGNGITVDSGNIYVCGFVSGIGHADAGFLYTNGSSSILQTVGAGVTYTTGITYSQGSVYISGQYYDNNNNVVPATWQGTSLQPLPESWANTIGVNTCITSQGANVLVGGYQYERYQDGNPSSLIKPYYAINGQNSSFDEAQIPAEFGSGSALNSLSVSGGNVYSVHYEPYAWGGTYFLYKNGQALQRLENIASLCSLAMLDFGDGNWAEVVIPVNTNLNYWFGGDPYTASTPDTNADQGAFLTHLAGLGTDYYFSGYSIDTNAVNHLCVWKNGSVLASYGPSDISEAVGGFSQFSGIALSSSGDLYIGSSFLDVNGVEQGIVIKRKANGSMSYVVLDSGGAGGSNASRISLRPSGEVVAVGYNNNIGTSCYWTHVNPETNQSGTRIDLDGSLVNIGTVASAVASPGHVYIGVSDAGTGLAAICTDGGGPVDLPSDIRGSDYTSDIIDVSDGIAVVTNF
jgi:hypothetical protein